MATNRNDAGNTPRLTTPLEPGAVPLSEGAQIQVRNVCWRCEGRKTLERIGHVRCLTCGKPTDADKIRTHGRDWIVLQCGHTHRSGLLDIRYDPCPTCGGQGALYAWKTLDELLEWAVQWVWANFEIDLGPISQIMTARQRAIG